MESRRAEGLLARRHLDGMSIEGPLEARVVVGLKGMKDFISRKRKDLLLGHRFSGTKIPCTLTTKKDPLLGHRSSNATKPPDPAPDEECT